jgi:hypothetical protein
MTWLLENRREFERGEEQASDGTPVIFLKSVVAYPTNFGQTCREIDASDYIGSRVRFTAKVQTDLPEGAGVQLWMRVDGDWNKRPEGCFDNMFQRRIKGKTTWTEHYVEVSVPEGSKKLLYGVILSGTGQVWLTDYILERVE